MAAKPSSSAKYILGIDLGTTSIKVVLFDTRSKAVIDSCTLQTDSDVINDTEEHVGFLKSLFLSLTPHQNNTTVTLLFTI